MTLTSIIAITISVTSSMNSHLQCRNACSSKKDQPAARRLGAGHAPHPAAPGPVAPAGLRDANANEATMQASTGGNERERGRGL